METVKAPKVENFVEFMKANPRPIEDKTPRPRPAMEELTVAKQESEAALASAKERRNTLTAKLSALVREIEVAASKVVEAEAARGALIERAVFENISSSDLAHADRAVNEVKTAEATLKAVHEATKKAHEALQGDIEGLKLHAQNHAKRYWGRIADDLSAELKAMAEEKVQRLWAASLRSGRAGEYADMLVRALPQPSAEQVREAHEELNTGVSNG